MSRKYAIDAFQILNAQFRRNVKIERSSNSVSATFRGTHIELKRRLKCTKCLCGDLVFEIPDGYEYVLTANETIPEFAAREIEKWWKHDYF